VINVYLELGKEGKDIFDKMINFVLNFKLINKKQIIKN